MLVWTAISRDLRGVKRSSLSPLVKDSVAWADASLCVGEAWTKALAKCILTGGEMGGIIVDMMGLSSVVSVLSSVSVVSLSS